MSAYSSPKVVILGKSDGSGSEMQDFLREIETSQIPYAFLDSVYVTLLENDERYKISRKHLTEGIDYQNIDRHLMKLGISKDVSLIEIVVNLDVAFEQLQQETAAFLDNIFDDDSN